MKSFRIALYILVAVSAILTGCRKDSVSNPVDVIYLVSTEVVSSVDESGNISYTAALNAADSAAIKAEMDYVRANMFGEPFNFISPYYHQFTFDAIALPEEQFDAVYGEVKSEVFDFFDNYIRNENNGRHFILAGFSQGAMLVQELLKHMDKDAFRRMDAAYALGYKITEEDLQNSQIIPAKGENDEHVVISFNTVLSEEGIWPLVAENTVACINPVNWKTDSTPATFTFGNQDVTIRIDQKNHVLMAETDPAPFHEWMENNPIFMKAGVSKDCLHHWDILFYGDYIYKNACLRSGIKLKKD